MWKGGSDKIVRDSRTKSCYPYRVARSGSEASARDQLEAIVDEARRNRGTLTVSASARI